MPSIAENIRRVVGDIQTLEQQYGRRPGSVSLLAVGKGHSAERIREAWQAGILHFGESYVQEAMEKMRALDLPGVTWHFVGPLQSNKTRDVASHFDWVHSVDRLRIARRLNAHRPADLPPLKVCVQVNISGEHSKSGTTLQETQALCEQLRQMEHLQLRGLMAIPAPTGDPVRQRAAFRALAECFRQLARQYEQFDTLSMGMSDDHAAAIAEGSTMIRLGTAIFGPRVAAKTG